MVVCEVLGEAAGDVGAAGLQDGCEACGAGGLHGDELVSLHLLLGDKMMLEDSPYIIIIIIIISPRCLMQERLVTWQLGALTSLTLFFEFLSLICTSFMAISVYKMVL